MDSFSSGFVVGFLFAGLLAGMVTLSAVYAALKEDPAEQIDQF